MCVPVPHLFFISEHKRHSHQKKWEGDQKKKERKETQPFSACHEERDLCRSFLFPPSSDHCFAPLLPPPPFPLTTVLSPAVVQYAAPLCFVCVDSSGGSPRFAVAAQRTACKVFMFTLTAVAVTNLVCAPPLPSYSPRSHLLALFLDTPRSCSHDARSRKQHGKWHNGDAPLLRFGETFELPRGRSVAAVTGPHSALL